MKDQLKLTIILLVAFTVGCRTFAQTQKSLTETERFKLAADYSRQNRGVSVLVMKGDKVVFEDYQNGHTARSRGHSLAGQNRFPA